MGSLHDSLPVPSLTSNELTFAVEETMMDSAVSKDTQKSWKFSKEHMTDLKSLQERNKREISLKNISAQLNVEL